MAYNRRLNIWGEGGLFEQRLQDRMRKEDDKLNIDRQNANANQAYREGIVDIGMMNANTDRIANVSPLQMDDAGQLDLLDVGERPTSLFNESGDVVGLRGSRFGQNTSGGSRTRPLSSSLIRSGNTNLRRKGLSEGPANPDDNFGFAYGGMVDKQKGMRQPGYKNGGKVKTVDDMRNDLRKTPKFQKQLKEATAKGYYTPNPDDPHGDISAVDRMMWDKNAPKREPIKKPGYKGGGAVCKRKGGMRGYATGGQIGDEMEDDGKDTVDVRVREGEYLLNPETVAAFGAGDYDAGTQVLDSIVTATTGEEPGPVPVNEEGEEVKMGFREGGTFFVDPEGNIRTKLGMDPRFTQNVDVRAAGNRVLDAGQRTLRSPTLGKVSNVAGRGATYVAPAIEALQTGLVAADEGSTGIDVATQAATGLGRLGAAGVGAAYGSTLGPVGTLAGGAAGYILGDQLIQGGREAYNALTGSDMDTRDPVEQIASRPVVAPTETPAETEAAPAPYGRAFGVGEPITDLRNMNVVMETGGPGDEVIIREDINGVPTFTNLRRGGFDGSAANLQREADARVAEEAARRQAGLRERAFEMATSTPRSAAATLAAGTRGTSTRTTKTDQRITDRFRLPVRDDDGQITDYVENPMKATAFRDAMSQLNIDVYSLTEAQQDQLFEEFEPVYDETMRLIQLGADRGVVVPDTPRTLADGTVPQRLGGSNIGLGDVMGPDATMGDWFAGLFDSNPVNDEFISDPVSGMRIPARRLVRDRNGNVDPRLLERYGYGRNNE